MEEFKVDISKVDHIGVAVESIEETRGVYEALGLEVESIEEVEEQKVRVAFLPVGETKIELLESTDPEGAIARFIDRNGPGIQHVALRVDDIERALSELKERGMRLIDEEPRVGAGGAKIVFLHPKSTKGVLLELCEK